MRLHRLEVCAFGPFAGTVAVDFDHVAGSGLFLIRGATGAGKTSLLDAVAFALFADVPGARSKKGLHSGHAAHSAAPSVSLEFTAGGRRLRLERSPEFSRPKSRGSGLTTVPAKAVLFEHRGSWQALSSRHDEIAEVVQDVLGLGMEQFNKVVLLPQGDFAAFLRATPEERRSLLERLFDVTTYSGVEQWLATRRKESATALAARQHAVTTDLGVLVELLAGAPATAHSPEGTSPPHWNDVELDELPARLTELRQDLAATTAAALADLEVARQVDAAATRATATAEELIGLQRRARDARARLAALDEGAADRDEAAAVLDSAHRAQSVAGDLSALARAEHAVTVADTARETALAAARLVPVDVPDPGDVHPDRPADTVGARLSDLLESLSSGTPLLDAAQLREAIVADRRGRRVATAGRLAALLAEQASSSDTVRDAENERTAAAAALVTAQLAVARAEEQARVVDDLCRRVGLLDRRASTRDDLDAARQAAAELRDVAQAARGDYQDLLQARLEGMAAELANGLADGDRCPVCGAQEHPALASSSHPVDAAAVEAAERTWRQSCDVANTAAARVAALDAALTALDDQLLAETRSREQVAGARDAARLAHAEAAALAATVPAREEAVASATARLAAATRRAVTVRDEVTGATSELRQIDADLAGESSALAEVLDQHLADCPCASSPTGPWGPAAGGAAAGGAAAGRVEQATDRVAGLRDHHDRALRAVRHLVAASGELATARDALHEVLATTQTALAAAGFASAGAARGALVPPERLVALKALVQAHDAARDTAQATLADPAVQAAEQRPVPDLAALAAHRDAARAALLAAASHESGTRRTADGVHRVSDSLTARCAGIAAAQAEHRVLQEVADTAAGTSPSNALRMRLSSFVLAARLEKVVVLANERLTAMGEGRYQLRHTDDLAGRGARSGLGLQVLDLWTGQTREPSSLSGGESFMASLALALGLAEAVREEAGGFDLQTLFVDEGFGTLDDDSLEQVMDVLDGLREGGRAVGVVSHVAELRTRIPSQVVVRKSERGSTVSVQLADETPAA